jgi:WD40 repeat protein/tetratricopeptide (TPR) repeat protein/tRNA A-37 threonylcarbamoyl transferase component Bud32
MNDPAPNDSTETRQFEDVLAQFLQAEEQGLRPDPQHYLANYPELADRLRAFFHDRAWFGREAPRLAPTPSSAEPSTVPHTPDSASSGLPAPSPPVLSAGNRFGGYEIVSKLGHGGMGIVYKARHMVLNHLVALKVIRTDRLQELDEGERRQWIARFYREARLVAALDQPAHIVSLHEVGEQDSQPYFTMRLVEGGSLAQRLRAVEAEGPEKAAEWHVREQRGNARLLAAVARAVHYAHQRGILHRDLKPANVLLDADGQPLVTDFGLARRLDETGSVVAGGFEGTAAYVAPEQARAAPGAATTAADVYGLGAILYELLTGRPPFRGVNDVETLVLVLTSAPVPPRQIEPRLSRDLETICLKCLEKEPGRRYPSAVAVAEDLENWLAGRPITARPTGTLERSWRWCRRNPVPAAAAGIILATVVTAFALVMQSRDQEAAAKDAALTLAEEKDDLAQKNGKLAEDYGKLAKDYQREAGEKTHLADKERDLRVQVQREFANSSVKQGQHFLERGDVPRGMLYLAHGLDLAHQVKAADLEQTSRTQLALWRFRFRAVKMLLPHADEVLAVAFSPDGRKIVTGGADQTARFWDATTGQPLGEPIRPPKANAAAPFENYGGGPLRSPLRPGYAGGFGPDGPAKHVGEVVAVAFSPDGRGLAVGIGDPFYRGRSQLVEAGDWMHFRRPMGLGRGLGATGLGSFPRSFEPGGTSFPNRMRTTTPPLWNVDTGKPLFSLPSGEPVWAVAFSPDGRMLVTGGGRFQKGDSLNNSGMGRGLGRSRFGGIDPFDPTGRRRGESGDQARLWDVAKGTLLRSLPHDGAVLAVAFSPDGRRILTGSADQTAQLWDAATGRPLGKALDHEGLVVAVAFSPDGRTILTASQTAPTRGAVHLWNADTGEALGQPLLHSSAVLAAVFSPDGRTVLTGSGDPNSGTGEARLWDVATGKPLAEPLPHPGAVHSVAWSPDGHWIVTGCADKIARVWGAVPAPAVYQLRHHETALAYSPDGSGVLLGTVAKEGLGTEFCKQVSLHETSSGKLLFPILQNGEATQRAVFSPDGRKILLEWKTGNDTGLQLVSAVGGKLVGKHFRPGGSLEAVAVSPVGHTVVTGTSVPYGIKGEATLWDANTGEVLRTFSFEAPVLSVAFSPDGATVAAGSGMPSTPKGEARLWDTGTGKLLQTWAHQGPVRVVRFSPDGRTLATAGDDRTVGLWDVASGKPRGTALAHNGPVRALVFSADSGRLLTGSDDRTAQLWNVATGKRIGAALTHRAPVRAVAISPDGTLLLTGSDDQTAQLWEAATGRPLEEPLAHQGPVGTVAFGGDGRTILTRSTQTNSVTRRRVGDAWETSVGLDWKSTGRVWALTAPVEDDPKAVMLWTQVLTGLELDADGQVRPLNAPVWQERRKRLGERGDLAPAAGTVHEWHRREARAAEAAGQWFAAQWHLERLGEDQPTSEDIPFHRGRAYFLSNRPDRAVPELTKALASDNTTAVTWYFRGRAYAALNQNDKAVADFSEAINRASLSLPKDEVWVLQFYRGQSYFGLGQMDKAVEDFSEVLKLKPENVPSRHARGMAYAEQGQLDRAAADFSAALQRPGAPARTWRDLAQARLQRGDVRGYRESCTAALQQLGQTEDPALAARLGQTEDPGLAAWLAWTCSLGPDATPDPEPVVRLASMAARQDLQNYVFHRAWGAALYRAGKYKDAVDRFTIALKLRDQPAPSVWLFLAMAHQRLEHPEEAKQWLDKARTWIGDARKRKANDKDGLSWQNLPWTERGALELLQAEAEKLIQSEAAKP